MGHYWSEMHVPSPHEDYMESVETGLKELGFRKIRVEYSTFYVCGFCSCVVLDPATHLVACEPSVSRFVYEQSRKVIETALKEISKPIERMDFLKTMKARGLNAYAFKVACDNLQSTGVIKIKEHYTDTYKDAVISPIVVEETLDDRPPAQ